MVLICLNKSSSSAQAVAAAGRFAVNILGEDQRTRRCASPSEPTPATSSPESPVNEGEFGEPLLADALANLDVASSSRSPAEPTSCFLAEVERASARAGAPLAYFRGQFGRLELAPG